MGGQTQQHSGARQERVPQSAAGGVWAAREKLMELALAKQPRVQQFRGPTSFSQGPEDGHAFLPRQQKRDSNSSAASLIRSLGLPLLHTSATQKTPGHAWVKFKR